ncbi:DUF488 family protein [Sporosarcina sp. BI001-red]|uniref:DUF488 domain-containing protein n=1 Tax=Sporosarcina sp. BI001-red TaxID=2282866 RepID=UPI000E22A9BC|nr:DUF488 family protein [Sporosarcina sp. BI001-red]REB07267.1 DUF488 family protein [Sporosarcina sp. BI001-red]
MPVKIKRIYEEKEKSDGVRILVDRVWPRGVSKEDAHVDEWVKEVGPSKELRQWFDHDTDKYDDFKVKYKKELKKNEEQKEALEKLKQLTKEHDKKVTLVFAAKDEKHNQAAVIKEILDHQ